MWHCGVAGWPVIGPCLLTLSPPPFVHHVLTIFPRPQSPKTLHSTAPTWPIVSHRLLVTSPAHTPAVFSPAKSRLLLVRFSGDAGTPRLARAARSHVAVLLSDWGPLSSLSVCSPVQVLPRYASSSLSLPPAACPMMPLWASKTHESYHHRALAAASP